MKVWSCAFFLALGFAQSAAAQVQLPYLQPLYQPADPISPTDELLLELDYSLTCNGSSRKHLNAVLGEIEIAAPDRTTVRFELWQGTRRQRLSLGTAARELSALVRLSPLDQNPQCSLHHFNARLVRERVSSRDLDQIARQHSPYLMIRDDQVANRKTDNPLSLYYSIHPQRNGQVKIRYTQFFSDEDSLGSIQLIKKQYTRYGRSNDIEWMYEITLRPEGGGWTVVKGDYQGFLHFKHTFDGDFWPGSRHPILHNDARNNIFSESGRTRISYRPAVDLTRKFREGEPRESVLFDPDGAYMRLCSALEARRENKDPGFDLEGMIFVKIYGKLASGSAIRPQLKIFDRARKPVLASRLVGDIDRLGESLYFRSSYSGIYVGKAVIQGLRNLSYRGELTFHDTNQLFSSSLKTTRIEFVTLQWDPIAQLFRSQSLREWNAAPGREGLKLHLQF